MGYTKKFLMELQDMIDSAAPSELNRWVKEYEHDLPHIKHDNIQDKYIMAAKNQFSKQEKRDLF